MLTRLALTLEAAWYQTPRWLLLLSPFEWAFAGLTALRRQLFRAGWLPSEHPGVPVVVVGNISAGGTGKTPVVIAIARALSDEQFHVAVVSRGYGGSATGVVTVDANSTVEQVGDEALLIARSTDALVVVGRDRTAAARAAVAHTTGNTETSPHVMIDVILSDDGLQHYALRRDIEVVTMDAQQGFGNGHLLPVGPLRETPGRLATVDFLLQRGGQDPHSGTTYRPLRFRRLSVGQVNQHGHDRGTAENCTPDATGIGPRVHALAAIASPQRFFNTLTELGFDVVEHPLLDHQLIDAAMLEKLADLPVVLTSKDAVKCEPGHNQEVWVLEMELQFPDEFIPRLVQKIRSLKAGDT